jgi:pimeloyl-ACP methyl ester carboxylesterase
MSATEGHGTGRDASVRELKTAPEVDIDKSGFTRGQVLRRGLAGGLALGATSVLPGVARAATRPRAVTQPKKARRLRDQVADPTAIHPFQVSFPNSQLADLSQRVTATRWPTKELVTDHSQGVQLATAQALARYWTTRYDWRAFEASLNALPQFMTEIDGVDVHFIHVRSKHPGALPLIMTHGWPGSIVELLQTIDPLTNPTAHGGTAADAFDIVFPSMPGYGFSSQPTVTGWNAARVASAWAELMQRLGYSRYVAQGGDVGAAITNALGELSPAGLIGIHMNILVAALGGATEPTSTPEEQAAAAALATFKATGDGYFIEQDTRPQTIGYALLDSPVAMAAWMLDHDTDSYYKISTAFLGGPPSGGLTRDHILDNMSVYWLTGTGVSSARSYWDRAQPAPAGSPPPPSVTIPVAFTAFPGEIFVAPESWVENAYPTLMYYHEAAKGGHFAAWEVPDLFTSELRAAFQPLR